jgi:hypothetical protein
MDDDLFYCVRNWRTTHYSKLEEYRKKNEFFQVPLDLIEEGVKRCDFGKGPTLVRANGTHFSHVPQVFHNFTLKLKNGCFNI